MSTPILTSPAEVEAFAAELAAETVIAVDLEADSMHSYREKVCLLQFSTLKRTVLIDPLAVSNLDALKLVLADPAVRKLFHAADYDIRCLFRDFGIRIRGLFDTMISCQFLGEERVGLADVLGKYYGVELDKQYQRADWSIRPLSPEMIRYAAEDTRHLHRLSEMLEGMLAEKGRLEWVAEEFELLEQVRHSENDGPLCLRLKGAGPLDRRQLGILEALLQWRDGEARRRDCPPFKVVGNKSFIEMARSTPATVQGLVGIEGFSPRQAGRYGNQILKAIAAGKALPPEKLPSYPRSERRERDPEADERLKLLKKWRLEAAAGLQIDAGVLINNALLEEISRGAPRTEEELGLTSGLKRWQKAELSSGILKALAG